MSDFFQPPPPREPDPIPEQPPWIGPPENELGVPVPLRRVLARTDDLAVALTEVAAYSTGLEFRIEIRLRSHDELIDPFGMRHAHRRGELSDDVLRFGFELADGTRVTNVDDVHPFGEPREGPVLIQRGGGGGGRSWSFGYWLWPLPPRGVLVVAVEWPGRGVELQRAKLDAGPLLDAAAESEQLWPVRGPDGGSSGTWALYRG